MSNFTMPVKVAFARYLREFHSQLIADTPAMQEFAAREYKRVVMWAPDRMIDQATEMLASWRKNDTSQSARPNSALPVMLIAMTKDFVPAPVEFGPGTSFAQDVQIPSDPQNRAFKLRRVTAEIRAQIVIAAAEDVTARSIAMQLHLFVSDPARRYFSATHDLAGLKEDWPVQIENTEVMAVTVPTDVKNLTVLAVDLSLYASVPFLSAPKSTQPNDGKGSGSNQDQPFAPGYNPSGFPVVIEAKGFNSPGSVQSGVPDWIAAELADEEGFMS